MFAVLGFGYVAEADAKRFGGGGFGKSYKTNPFKKQQAAPTKQSSNNKASSNRKGMMGGMLGGLLAGGLLASLIGGGAFENIQMMDILLIGGLIFLLFKMFKGSGRRQQYATQPPLSVDKPLAHDMGETRITAAHAFQSNGDVSTSNVPFVLPQGFDVDGFLQGSLSHYRTVQQAWNEGDFNSLGEYLSKELVAELKSQRETLDEAPQTEILYLDAQLVRANQIEGISELSILFQGRCKDDTEQSEDPIYDIWHLEKNDSQGSGDWMIVGIEASE